CQRLVGRVSRKAPAGGAWNPAPREFAGNRDRVRAQRCGAVRSRRARSGGGRAGHRQRIVCRNGSPDPPPATARRRLMTTSGRPTLPPGHPEIRTGRIGVLLVNLGTPEAPEPGAVKRYLAEFLSDRRVVEIPPIAWQPILRGIILNTRPRKSA